MFRESFAWVGRPGWVVCRALVEIFFRTAGVCVVPCVCNGFRLFFMSQFLFFGCR